MSYLRVAGIAGIAGPVAFTVAWVTAALTLPGYSSRAEDISDLAAPAADQPAIAIMVAGFVVLGLSILVLAWGLWRAVAGAGYLRIVAALLVVIGVSVSLSGGFRSDCSEVHEACRQRIAAGDASLAHHIHNGLTAVIFPLTVVSPALLAWGLRDARRDRLLAIYSLVTAVLTAALLALYLTDAVEGWNGAVQRVFVSVPLLWVAVLGGRLLRGAATAP